MFFSPARDSNACTMPLTNGIRSSSRACSFMRPASNLEISSNWLIRRCRRRALRCMMERSLRDSASLVRDRSFSNGPRIRVSGVRNSWEILVKKRDFRRSTSRSFSRSRCSSSSRCCISTRSRKLIPSNIFGGPAPSMTVAGTLRARISPTCTRSSETR